MKDLVLVIQENYNGTITIAEPVDRNLCGVDYIGICTADSVEMAKEMTKKAYPNYRLQFQYN